MTQRDNIFVSSSFIKQGGYGKQSVKPTPCLIYAFCDKIRFLDRVVRRDCGRLLALSPKSWILGEWHRPGIKPNINDFRNPLHFFFTFITVKSNFINIGTM